MTPSSMLTLIGLHIIMWTLCGIRVNGTFWQHTDVGNVPGIKEDVDLNVFNGSLEELKKS